MLNIGVLVSGGGTNLQAILDAIQSGQIPEAKIVKVISSKEGAYALTRAKNAGVDGVALVKKNFPSNEAYMDEMIRVLQQAKVDLVVLAGFMTVLSPEFIAAFPNRILNIHPSLIPSFCGVGYYGLKVHEAALQRGVKVTGATVHFVNEETDGGPIFLQKTVEVREDDTPQTLQQRVMEEAEWKILPEAIRLLSRGEAEVIDGKVRRVTRP